MRQEEQSHLPEAWGWGTYGLGFGLLVAGWGCPGVGAAADWVFKKSRSLPVPPKSTLPGGYLGTDQVEP